MNNLTSNFEKRPFCFPAALPIFNIWFLACNSLGKLEFVKFKVFEMSHAYRELEKLGLRVSELIQSVGEDATRGHNYWDISFDAV